MQDEAAAIRAFAGVAQPNSSQYNGQGLIKPSVYLPLFAPDFDAAFGALWAEHVDFGTSRSHKKAARQHVVEGAAERKARA